MKFSKSTFFKSVIILFFIILFVGGYVFYSISTVQCGNEIIAESISPDKKYIAYTYERNCGATTPYIRIASLRLAGTEFKPNEDWIFAMEGQTDIKLSWIGDTTLNISYSYSGDTLAQKTVWKNITISYVK